MKKGIILIISIICTLSNIKGQNFKEFKSTLDDCGMNINIPSGYTENRITENADMGYEYALKKPDSDFEVRYSIRPIRYKKYANDTVKNEIEDQRPFRNTQYEIIFKTVILNITGGIEYKYTVFDLNAVKSEFNADWGATTFVNLNPNGEFGKGYKFCMIVTIHKKDFADAYYFYLSNSKDKFMERVDPLFHSLKFD